MQSKTKRIQWLEDFKKFVIVPLYVRFVVHELNYISHSWTLMSIPLPFLLNKHVALVTKNVE